MSGVREYITKVFPGIFKFIVDSVEIFQNVAMPVYKNYSSYVVVKRNSKKVITFSCSVKDESGK